MRIILELWQKSIFYAWDPGRIRTPAMRAARDGAQAGRGRHRCSRSGGRDKPRRSPGMANWAKRFRCPQVVLAPDEEDALRGRPNLGRRIPIARLATSI